MLVLLSLAGSLRLFQEGSLCLGTWPWVLLRGVEAGARVPGIPGGATSMCLVLLPAVVVRAAVMRAVVLLSLLRAVVLLSLLRAWVLLSLFSLLCFHVRIGMMA